MPDQVVAVFACPFNCRKTFIYAASLKNHAVVHKDKVHYCEVCNPGGTDKTRLYASRRSLKQHMRRYHVLRKFGCITCTRRFLTQEQLDAHREKHNLYGIDRS